MRGPSTLMRRPHNDEPLLQPVNPKFIWITLVLAFLLNLFPWGQLAGVPDFLALTLLFWGAREPRYVGMLPAFAFGLAMDVHIGSLLGQHAFAYVMLVFLGAIFYKRLAWFSSIEQTIYVLPLFFVSEFIILAIRSLLEKQWIGWSWIWDVLTVSLLWPLISWLLLIPQRRPISRDDDRPI